MKPSSKTQIPETKEDVLIELESLDQEQKEILNDLLLQRDMSSHLINELKQQNKNVETRRKQLNDLLATIESEENTSPDLSKPAKFKGKLLPEKGYLKPKVNPKISEQAVIDFFNKAIINETDPTKRDALIKQQSRYLDNINKRKRNAADLKRFKNYDKFRHYSFYIILGFSIISIPLIFVNGYQDIAVMLFTFCLTFFFLFFHKEIKVKIFNLLKIKARQ